MDNSDSLSQGLDQQPTKPLLKALRWVLLTAVIVFVAKYVVTHWQSVREVPAPQAGPLFLATLLGLITAFGFAGIIWQVLRVHGYQVSFSTAFGLRFLPPMGKYLPGKIWSVLGSLWLYNRCGIPKHVTLVTIGLAAVLGMLGKCLVILIMQALSLGSSASSWSVVAATLLLLLGLHPRVFYPSANWVFRRMGKPPMEEKFSLKGLLLLVIGISLIWAVRGAALFFVLRSTAFVPLESAPQCIAIFLLAQVAGFIALFAPAGIGVREAVLLVGLRPLIGDGPAIVVAAIARLWQTVIELSLAGIGWWLLRPGEFSDITEVESV